MNEKTRRQEFTKSITVQESECEDFLLVPVSFLKSMRKEIDGLRAQLGLSPRQWEPAPADDAVGMSSDEPVADHART